MKPTTGRGRVRAVLRLAATAVGLLVGLAMLLLRHGATSLDSQPRLNHVAVQADTASWEEILAQPRPIRVETLVTGTVTGDRFVVLDPDDPNISKAGPRDAPSVVLAHLVRHEQYGDFLVDAGLSQSFTLNRAGNYTALLRTALWLIGAEVDQPQGTGLGELLQARGAEPTTVFLTHLHADHTSGLEDLAPAVTAVFGRGEDTFSNRALMGAHLDGRPLQTLDFSSSTARRPFSGAIDLLGDGSLWALSTPGHSPDHVSYLVNGSEPVLLTGDAVAYVAQFEHHIRPSPHVHDPVAAHTSALALSELAQRVPALRIVVGHELAAAAP
ncbi:MAG: MBL fold metallo-hydrolase [Nannocystales bacterium]